MGQTSIEWTATYHPDGTVTPGYTFNPWVGCQKISSGCKNCYAERDFTRKPRWANTWGPPATSERLRTSDANWKKPLAWNKRAQKEDIRYKVFCASLADVFEDNDSLIDWRLDLFEVIRGTPNLDWLMPTKRPEIAYEFFKLRPDLLFPNIVPGTSIEDQKTADARVPWLLQIPSVRFVSCEPLLGPIDLTQYLANNSLFKAEQYADHFNFHGEKKEDGSIVTTCGDGTKFYDGIDLHWLIGGGESGPRARPMHPDWARSLRDQCQAAGVPFFFKQWGEWKEIQLDKRDRGDILFSPTNGKIDRLPDPFDGNMQEFKRTVAMRRVGKKVAGRLLDGREYNEMPEVA